jgi:hypothetical protein
MASAAQIEANRKNAQKSTGPVTPEGKAKSGRNSIRHGLLSRVIPIDAPGYRELLDGLYTSLTPQNELERMLVDQIAITTMRLRRIWGAEQNYLYTKSGNWPDGPDANSATVHSYLEVPTAVTYLRYESMLNRLLARLLHQYHAIRSDESWAKISRSDSPYIQEEVTEQPAEEAPTEQHVASVEERSIESAAQPETANSSLSTIASDIDARIAALAKIPYNEFLVQSRVAAYDAHRNLYDGR